MKLRVVTYNVLSSHLASPNHFTTLNPDHLEAKNRLPVVLSQLEQQIQEERKCVICLQEVSYDWAAAFHVFFAKQGYHLVTGLYGKKFNGYMGIALAWPTDLLEVVDVDIARLSDKRVGGWPRQPEKAFLQQLWETVQYKLETPLSYIGWNKEKVENHWEIAQWRSNVILTATLRDKESGQLFCIGNYHMPCVYWAPMVMTIHSEMAVKHVQKIAAKQQPKIPCILAGDFNLKPTDSSYRLITTNQIDKGDPTYPTPMNGYEWNPTMEYPMRSAYAEFSGEPNFTNYARIKEEEPFIDTLDYIFLSPTWKIQAVKPLPHRDNAGGPFPNLEKGEPSDHVLIAADLVCTDNEQ